ncbi:FAD-dependent monooxygenase [Streptomyces sp. NPDC047197]|uniref:FAD-dependent oxidoreductase n=1 Tax=Streptomyces sp. NPDC047197 TaxID=3155477 RepID=UPI0033D8698D
MPDRDPYPHPLPDTDLDVLVIGAGPAGLALAADLARYGVRCQVAERRPAPRPGARCPNVWRRTMYAYARLGQPPHELRAHGVPMRSKVFHVGDRTAAVSLLEDADDQQWPYPLLVRQDQQEEYLTALARQHGCPVRQGVTATVLDQEQDCVRVELSTPEGRSEVLRAAWVVAADGAQSLSRAAVGVDWKVRGHDGVAWWQVDAGISGVELPPEREDLFHAPYSHVGMVPLADGRHRVFLASGTEDATVRPSFGDVERLFREVVGPEARLHDPQHLWWHTPVEGRAEQWLTGRVILLGEAARVFPMPVHGLNTGIQDAANLAWKLSAVVQRHASVRLLDTYEVERRQVAEVLMERGERVLRAGVAADPEATLGPILIEGSPRIRTEPAPAYEASPLTAGAERFAEGCVGQWIASWPVHTPAGVWTVSTLQSQGQWLVLSPSRMPLSVTHPLNPRVVNRAQLAGCNRLMITIVRPDGYVGAEIPFGAGRSAQRSVLEYFDRVAGGG